MTLQNQDLVTGEWVNRATATCFIAERGDAQFLVSNWHVFVGRNADTNEYPGPRAVGPSRAVVWHPVRRLPGTGWLLGNHDLYDEHGSALWLVHPRHQERRVDLAALPLRNHYDWPYLVDDSFNNPPSPSMDVSIVGFPYGMDVGGFAVWSRGAVATEPSSDYRGDPVFLVDSRTRESQSGSPVVVFRPGALVAAYSQDEMPAATWDLVGVYAGRTSEHSDLGRVWKREALTELLDGGVRDRETYP